MKIVLYLVATLFMLSEAQAKGCTPNYELSRILPEYSAVMLDGGEIKRVMFLNNGKDERLSTWKPGRNITYCPDQNKMINTTIYSVAPLVPEYSATCDTLANSNEIDRALENAWKYANQPYGNPKPFLPKQNLNLAGIMKFAPTTQRECLKIRISRIFSTMRDL